MTRGRGFADDPEWDLSGSYVVLMSERHVMHGPDGWTGRLAYDGRRARDAEVCNVSRLTGDVCRLPRDHPGRHVPFSGELVATTGVFVESISG